MTPSTKSKLAAVGKMLKENSSKKSEKAEAKGGKKY